MAKKQTFADKLKKKQASAKTCPVCNEPIEYVLMVKSVEREDGKGYKFNQDHIGICKCNEKEVFA